MTSFENRVKEQELTIDDLIKALEDVENVDESIFPAVVSNGYEQFVSAYQLKIILENLVDK